MIPFPRDVDIPKYDKYDGNEDPHNYIRQFYALSMEFMHDDTCLMWLFPISLNGQATESFTKITPPLKSFDELVKRFIQHYSYNISHPITMLDLCNMKQKVGEPFFTYLQGGESYVQVTHNNCLRMRRLVSLCLVSFQNYIMTWENKSTSLLMIWLKVFFM